MTPFQVLIVDDEPAFGRSLARALRRRGVDSEVVHDAGACLERAQAGSYEVVLLDNRLPDVRGMTLIPRLGGLMPGCSIFMMTAYGTFPEAVQAIQLGAEDFIDKSTSSSVFEHAGRQCYLSIGGDGAWMSVQVFPDMFWL